MSHGPSSVTIRDISQIAESESFQISKPQTLVLWGLVLLGLLAFGFGLTNGDEVRTWAAFHVNFIFWLFLAATSACFSAVLTVCNAQWARPIRRIFESTCPFFLICLGLLFIVYLGHGHLFEWAHHEIPGKGIWLTSSFVFIRDFLGLLVLALLTRKLVYLSVRRDIGAIYSGLANCSDEAASRWKGAQYNQYVRNWGDDAKQEIQSASLQMIRLSPVIIIVFSLVMSFVAFDLVMSVDPHWFSTLFGAFCFMSGVYLAMAWGAIGVNIARLFHPLIRAKVERRTLHDLGKLLFGFGIFWAYLFWSHYLPIWYGNMPEETGWVITRLREAPWHGFAWAVFCFCFIVPFFLGLSRDVKQTPVLLYATGVIVVIGLWLQGYLLFVPTLYPNEIPLTWVDVAIAFGFLGGFLLSVVGFLKKVPLIPFGDLLIDS